MVNEKILIATIPQKRSDYSGFNTMLKTYLLDMFPHLQDDSLSGTLLHPLCITGNNTEELEFTLNEVTEFLSKAKITRGLAVRQLELLDPTLDPPYQQTKDIRYSRNNVRPQTTTLKESLERIVRSGAGAYDIFIVLSTSDIPEEVLSGMDIPYQIIGSKELQENLSMH
jgi:hypothetical protein